MKFEKLRAKLLEYPVFRESDVLKWFPNERLPSLQVQFSRWVKERKLIRLKRGIYLLGEYQIKDQFSLASILCKPSYISLETALNSLGIIPDIPAAVTSVTVNKTCQFKTDEGIFIYHKIKKELFFGYTKIKRGPFVYFIAQPEKAVLDYLYFKSRGIYPKSLLEVRFEIERSFNWKRFEKQAKYFKKTSKQLIENFIKKYKR